MWWNTHGNGKKGSTASKKENEDVGADEVGGKLNRTTHPS
jgi:hypothetical protein